MNNNDSSLQPKLSEFAAEETILLVPLADPKVHAGPEISSSSSDPHPTEDETGNGRQTPVSATANTVVVDPGKGLPRKTRGRGADAKFDNIWTRFHALCMLALIADIKLGGYDSARQVTDFRGTGGLLKEVPGILLVLCPWLLNADYLNLTGSVGLAKLGLVKSYYRWASNRVYYFFYAPGQKEHPAKRVRHNLRSVYGEFYGTFYDAVLASTFISEESAFSFWVSVSNRVPFHLPPAVSADAQANTEMPRTGVRATLASLARATVRLLKSGEGL